MNYYRMPKGYLKTDKEYPQFVKISEEEYLANVPPEEAVDELTDSEALAIITGGAV